MAYLVGALLALAVGRLGTVVGLDRDRAFYPTIMIVIAFYYILFAVIGGSGDALLIEAAVAAVFLAAALVGFKYSLWLVVAALAAHGISMCFMASSSPIQGCRHGGRRSARRTTGRQLGTSHTSNCVCEKDRGWLREQLREEKALLAKPGVAVGLEIRDDLRGRKVGRS